MLGSICALHVRSPVELRMRRSSGRFLSIIWLCFSITELYLAGLFVEYSKFSLICDLEIFSDKFKFHQILGYFVICLQWNLRGTKVQIYDKILTIIMYFMVCMISGIFYNMLAMKLRCKFYAKILCYNDNTSLKLYSFCIFRHVRIIMLVFKLCIL